MVQVEVRQEGEEALEIEGPGVVAVEFQEEAALVVEEGVDGEGAPIPISRGHEGEGHTVRECNV